MNVQMIAPALVAACLIFSCFNFYRHYWKPGTALREELQHLGATVKQNRGVAATQIRGQLSSLFVGSRFEHAWGEFDETLHDQTRSVDGEEQVVRVRATAPATAFFSQAIIDNTLRVEFYKHLPGILTGLGIIGTFGGLLVGLSHFDPSGDPASVQGSLGLLLSGVRDAFIASFLAILLAMGVTFFEKKLFRELSTKLDELTAEIDHLFDAGVGEEYLSKLVHSAEESAVQTRMLKDSLVTDLREMLQNMVDSQIRAQLEAHDRMSEKLVGSYQSAGESMAASISGSIENAFSEPLNRIAESVQQASGNNSQQVQGMLQEILVAFMAKLESTFGQQFIGLSEMMQQSVMAMQNMQSSFGGLIAQLEEASRSSGNAMQQQMGSLLTDMQRGQSEMQDAMNSMLAGIGEAVQAIGTKGEEAGSRMGEHIARLLEDAESRQRAMSEQMQAVVDAMHSSVAQGQAETMKSVQTAIEGLNEQMTAMVSRIEEGQRAVQASTEQTQNTLAAGAQAAVGEMSTQVGELIESLKQMQNDNQASLNKFSDHTDKVISGMQNGADKMRSAAECFESAGDKLAAATLSTKQMSDAIQGTTGSLITASGELSRVLDDYRNTRDAMQKTLASLDSMVQAAQNEAGVRHELVADLKAVADRMRDVNREAGEYLDKIGGVTEETFKTFDAGMQRSLKNTLTALDTDLTQAIKVLSGGINDLGGVVEELSDTVETAVRRP